MHLSGIIKNNCTSNSQVSNFDCYEYNYFLIVLKCMQLPTDHKALPMTLSPYPWIAVSSK